MSINEIFDWLREQIAKLHEIDLFTIRYVNRDKVHKLITEAEAKWEADCCEWKDHTNKHLNSQMTSCGKVDDDYKNSYKFCPYCGKRIKIAEVE